MHIQWAASTTGPAAARLQARGSLTVVSDTDSLPVRTQFLIFTLYGEYILERGGTIWVSSLLYLMGLLNVSERAVRTALSRMTRKNWLVARRHGRRSQYSITPRGRALLEKGRQRIFEPIFTDWDGNWHLLTYSLPEKKRHTRANLRHQLSWLGFGKLAPGVWISPHDRTADLFVALEELNVQPYVSLFSGRYLGPLSDQDLVNQCWDWPELEAQYRAFHVEFEPEYRQFRAQKAGNETPSAEQCFVRRFWLTHTYQSFPLRDPNLPTSLLASSWIGFTTRRLFEGYHQLLGTYANRFVDDALAMEGPLPN